MNIYKELAQAVVDKYPQSFAENYHEHIGNEYPYASKELVDKIFEATLQIEGVYYIWLQQIIWKVSMCVLWQKRQDAKRLACTRQVVVR